MPVSACTLKYWLTKCFTIPPTWLLLRMIFRKETNNHFEWKFFNPPTYFYCHEIIFRTTGCGGTITQNSTHIQNTGYPDAYTLSTSCIYTFKKLSLSICAIRLDYVVFVSKGPTVTGTAGVDALTNCEDDLMTFTTPSSKPPPTLCGYISGQHIYLDPDRSSLVSNPTMTLTFDGEYLNLYHRLLFAKMVGSQHL